MILAVEDQFRAAFLEPDRRAVAGPTVIVHSSPSLRRQSRLAWSGPSASGLEKTISAAIGVCASSGTRSSADRTNRSPGKILVAIDKALMPGSNTPNPPGSQIHCWPGCHLWTSSCQWISSDLTRLPASALAAASTAALCCACQVVKRLTSCAWARQSSAAISARPAVGGFSSRQWRPASDAFARDFEARLGRRGDCHRLESLDAADEFPPIGEGLRDALPRTARGRDQLEARIGLNRWNVLVVRDLAVADDRDADRLHFRPAT